MDRNILVCAHCGFQNPEKAKFCVECGTKVEIRCQNCGKENPPTHKFCFECGGKLSIDATIKDDKPLNLSEPQSYIPKHLADKILVNRANLEGERKLVTVLFTDASSFTALSEKLDPEEVRSLMNQALRLIIDQVHLYEGTINKFTGDGAMALFGAPIAQEDHAYRSVNSALGIQNALRSYGEKLKSEQGIDFKMRIGINTGLVVVGSIGNDLSMEYTAMGDTVNLASRLEGLAEPGSILVSESTYKLVKDYFEFIPLEEAHVKGKSQPVKAYSVIGKTDRKVRFDLSLERGLTRFVGREKELGLIKDSLEKVKKGHGQIIGIIGEAGLGKSRLVHEFKTTFRDKDVSYLEGNCISYGKSFSYLPIIEILKNSFEIDDRDDDDLIKTKVEIATNRIDGRLRDTIPLILDLLSVKTDSDILKNLDAGQKRQAIFDALKAIILRISQTKPVVIAIEDLHWIDKTSEEFLNSIARTMGNERIMLLFTCRPGCVHSLIDKSYYTQIALSSLSTGDCRFLVESILSGGDISEELMGLIIKKAGGNALFVEEVTRSLLDSGTIVESDGGYTIDKEASQIDVPSSVQDIIMARIDRLEESRKSKLQVCSVIGREFSFELLQKISAIDENELRERLMTLTNSDLIYESGVYPDLDYLFKHALTLEVAYNTLLLQKRKELHEKVGSAIEEMYPSRLEEFYGVLAHHFSKSDNREKAVHYLTLVGKKAKEVLSTDEALTNFNEALKLLGQMEKTDTNEGKRIDILFEIENIYDNVAKRDDQKKILEEIITLSQAINDKSRLSDGYIKQGELLSVVGECQKAKEICQSALTLKREIGDKVGEGKALRGMGFINWRSADYNDALKYHKDALRVHREVGSREAEGFELISLGEVYRKLGQYEDALSHLHEAFNLHRAEGIVTGQNVSAFNIGNVYGEMGNYEKCAEYYRECWRIIKESGFRSFRAYSHLVVPISLANVYSRLGNYDDSLQYYADALDISRGLGDKKEEGNILSYIAATYNILGEYGESINRYKEALEIYRELGDMEAEGAVLNHIGDIYRQYLNDYREALSFYKKSLDMAKKNGDEDAARSILNNLGVVSWNLGFHDEALAYYQEALEICRKVGNIIGEGVILSGMAIVYLSLSEYDEALRCNEEALNILKPTGDQKVEGYILNSIGNVYNEMGDYQKAWRYYQESLRIRRELQDKKGEAWAHHNLGRVYMNLSNYQEASKHYEEALSLAEELGEEELTVSSKDALSEIKGVEKSI
jgi:predicted ATPase/class 3 adenylate cyclase/ribosomal protein L40E